MNMTLISLAFKNTRVARLVRSQRSVRVNRASVTE